MKILYVTARLPYPPLKGDQAVPWNRLRFLAAQHEITLLSFYESSDQLQHVPILQRYCSEVHLVKLSCVSSLASVAMRAPIKPDPMQVLYYRSGEFEKKLNELISSQSFDLVHAFMLRISPYLRNVSTPKILELIDSMQLNLQRRIGRSGGLMKRVWSEELSRVSRFENKLHEDFDCLIVTSERDRALVAGNNVRVLALGVDTETFYPCPKIPESTSVVFSGNMAYAPNIDAACWFVEQCFPILRSKASNASLTIVGANPSKAVRDLARVPGVQVVGFVESMNRALNAAQVAIAPMRSGSGMQFKILEAMACGLPVVATSLGLGDIKARPEEEIFIGDSAEEFANQVARVLADYELARSVGEKARDFVIRNHSWSAIADEVRSVYEELACNARAEQELMNA